MHTVVDQKNSTQHTLTDIKPQGLSKNLSIKYLVTNLRMNYRAVEQLAHILRMLTG